MHGMNDLGIVLIMIFTQAKSLLKAQFSFTLVAHFSKK